MATKEHSPINHPLRSWQESLNLPGAFQMQYARYLLEAHPYFTRIPDQSMILSSQGDNNTRITATRDSEGTYALVYTEAGLKFTLDLTKLSGKQNKALWFDPRNGRAIYFGTFENNKPHEFVPPSSGIGNDWVLVLDDASKNYTLATREKSDFISPSAPVKLSVTNISPVGAMLQWQPSTDNVRVSGYHIFLNDKMVAATTENKIELNNLMPETEYIVSIKSTDEALNYSVSSDSITFKTTKDIKIKTINISGPTGKLELGKNFQLNATVLPEKVIFKTMSWYAEDTTVVKVSDNGLVSPLKPGITVVYARSGEVVSNKISLTVNPPSETYAATYTPEKLNIDGVLDEKEWPEMIPALKSFDLKTDNQMFFNVLWDSTYLYVGAKITDRSNFSDSEFPWDDDAVEIYIDGNGNKSSSYDQFDRQFVCSFDKPLFEARGKVTSVLRKVIKTNAGFDMEIAIPWSNIGIHPTLNALIGFDISNTNDIDGNGRDGTIFWKGNPMDWADTRGFGNVVLEK